MTGDVRLQRSESFRDELESLEQLLRETGCRLVDHLAPGLSEDQIRARLDELGMTPSGELLAWYQWHDGVLPSVLDARVNPKLIRWVPMSLGEAITDWATWPRGEGQWVPGWLPIGHYNNATRLAVDCTPVQGDLARLHCAMPEYGLFDFAELPVVEGFATVVHWWRSALEDGHIQYDAANDSFDLSNWAGLAAARRRTGLV